MAKNKNNTNSDTEMMKYNIQHVIEKLDQMDTTLNNIQTQTTKTNGRVTRLENKSIGVWISNNILTFMIYTAIFFTLVISDFRKPIIELLLKFI